jgi:hypothetical protein
MHRTTNPWKSERPRRAASQSCFNSAKTPAPVRFDGAIVHKALVHLTLDPAVRAIDVITSVDVLGANVPLDAIVVHRADGRHLLDIVEARKIRDLDDEALVLLAIEKLGLKTLTLDAAEIRRQPYATNCRLVWNCRNVNVQASDRVRILNALTEDGPMALGRLASEARWTTDAVGAVLSLACQDLVEVELQSSPLGPWTVVRQRDAMPGGSSRHE